MKPNLFIDGTWRPAADGRTFTVEDPATEQLLARVADGTIEDALAAVAAADRALPAWSARSPRERGEILRRAFELMIERRDAIARLIVQENGKAWRDAVGEVVISAMLRDSRVRKLSFTGSTEVGRLLLAQAAERVVSCSMELGGNAPFIVLNDADVDAAVQGAMIAKMRNGGQACTAANRFYVQRGIAPAFVTKLVAAMAALKMGNGLDADVGVGPLVNAEARDKVQELVEDAVARGARVRLGGKTPEGTGFFYPPTVLDGVPCEARVLSEEIFGPVAPIVEFDDENDAVRLANDTEYGLVSYLYTKDLALGLRLAERLDAGMVGLNRGLVSDPAAPFGGMKQSGIGREGGHDGLLEFMEKKYVAVEW